MAFSKRWRALNENRFFWSKFKNLIMEGGFIRKRRDWVK
jgi:hypothetical protein